MEVLLVLQVFLNAEAASYCLKCPGIDLHQMRIHTDIAIFGFAMHYTVFGVAANYPVVAIRRTLAKLNDKSFWVTISG